MAKNIPLSWTIRRFIYDMMIIIIFRQKEALPIPLPPEKSIPLNAIPLIKRNPEIAIHNINVADGIPDDELSKKMIWVYRLKAFMYKYYPAMQKGLPEIDENIKVAIADAYTERHRELFPAPVIPPELDTPSGVPDLGVLAVKSPYACFLTRDKNGHFFWDFRDLDSHEIEDGLYPLGLQVFFELNEKSRTLHATKIESALGEHTPAHKDWHKAVKLALCAASTQTSLVRHFNWVHLACGGPVAIATRNRLPHNHPICRLVWPHIYGTQNSNYLVTRGQMLPGGEFETIFSFTHAGMCDLFEKTYNGYSATAIVPKLDWKARGLEGAPLDAPVQENLEQLYDVMYAHALRYISSYYENDGALQNDQIVKNWIAEFDRTTPNGLASVLLGPLTRESLARLVGGIIYMAAVQHEAMGGMLWNYQMWVDRNPVRVYKNEQRIPLDVYQRLVNANFNLHVNRAKLIQDFRDFGLDVKGRDLFQQFQTELTELNTRMQKLPQAYWRIMPEILDANINA